MGGGNVISDYCPRFWRATVVDPAKGNLGKLCL